MSIVKALLDKMGGSIEVESQLGEGSTFTFRLPFKVDENAIETKKKSRAQANRSWKESRFFWLRIMRSTWRLQSSI